MLVFTGVYVCVKAKLTLVSFFSLFFFCTFFLHKMLSSPPQMWMHVYQLQPIQDVQQLELLLHFVESKSQNRSYTYMEHLIFKKTAAGLIAFTLISHLDVRLCLDLYNSYSNLSFKRQEGGHNFLYFIRSVDEIVCVAGGYCQLTERIFFYNPSSLHIFRIYFPVINGVTCICGRKERKKMIR